MRHSTHPWTVLLAVGLAACAQAQTSAPTYGPVLHPPTSQPAQGARDAAPRAQEERAGAAAQQQRHNEVDPSARPAPQPAQPEPAPPQDKKPDAKKDGKAKPSTARRHVRQRIEPTPRIAAPSAHPHGRVADPAAGAPSPVPAPAQVNSCSGGVCVDTKGTVYNTSGNAAVSSDGRVCNRGSGGTLQCF